MATEVSSNVIERLLSEARRAHPLECCGILLGHGEVIVQARAAANVHPDPRQHFEIDPQALIDAHRAARDGDLQVLGYYHSHPMVWPSHLRPIAPLQHRMGRFGR